MTTATTTEPTPALLCCDDPDACLQAGVCLAESSDEPDVEAESQFRRDLRELMDTFRSQNPA